MKICCVNMKLILKGGKMPGQGAPCREQHIQCISCGKITSGRSWWYTDKSDVDIIEELINEWNNTMEYTFYLRNTATGECNTRKNEYKSEGDMLFLWLEGDYACDCNRSLFLYDFDREKQLECGDEIIVIDKIVRPDGSCVDMDTWETVDE